MILRQSEGGRGRERDDRKAQNENESWLNENVNIDSLHKSSQVMNIMN